MVLRRDLTIPYFYRMMIHLIDGTYELFRHFYGMKKAKSTTPDPYGAVRGVLHTVLRMVETGATHIGVATDHVIESFRNRMWAGYKTGAGIDPALWAQFWPLEDALSALGIAVWPMIELEADDALASAAHIAAQDPRVDKVCIWTPDKDLAQCVVGERVVQVDRKSGSIRDAAGVQAKFGVLPESIPDYLALVGDSADGYPGLPGWGAKSAAGVLSRFTHIEAIPVSSAEWRAGVFNAAGLAQTLAANRELALLFRDLATLRINAPLFADVETLRWLGPTPQFEQMAVRLGGTELLRHANQAAGSLARH